MIEDIFILGATGNVGKTLVKQIFEKGNTDFNLHVNPTRIIGLASSSSYMYNQNGIYEDNALNFISNKKNGFSSYENLDTLLYKIKNTYKKNDSNLVFVDVTAANKEMINFHKKVVNNSNYGIVTANKNPIAFTDFEDFKKLTEDPVRYGYRCAVMAGAEAISMLQDLKDVNDLPKSIKGSFSGTLGYITSELEKQRKLSEIVKEALQISKGWDVDKMSDEELFQEIEKLGIELYHKTRGEAILKLFEEYGEPIAEQPTHFIDYPKEATVFCKSKRDNPDLIERFESFVCGMELCNAYSELNDAVLQRKLLEEQVKHKEAGNEETWGQLDEEFLEAMELGMPPAGGIGIGIDRLAMILLNQESIRDIIYFPTMKPKTKK